MKKKKFTDKRLKPSEVLEFAIEDFAKAVKARNVEINMCSWFDAIKQDEDMPKKTCKVCLAGSVIAFSLGALDRLEGLRKESFTPALGLISKGDPFEMVDINYSLDSDDFEPHLRRRFEAIDEFRIGAIRDGLERLGIKNRKIEKVLSIMSKKLKESVSVATDFDAPLFQSKADAPRFIKYLNTVLRALKEAGL